MRLTLRTMLAYLDDVLDPADAQELEHKIEESSFANGLVHRIRDSMRRMRLGAPKIEGRGLGLDANTVADYLDSTLPPERVPEFEKVCLESDVHLAEVASCHQILTLVLGQPAQVDTVMRERIYRIGQPTHEPSNQAGVAVANSNGNANGAATYAAAASASPKVRSANAQRPTQLPIKSLAITVLIGFLIALVGLQAIGVDRIRAMVGLAPSTQVVDKNSPAPGDADEPVISIPAPEDTIVESPASTSDDGRPVTADAIPPNARPANPATAAADRNSDLPADPNTPESVEGSAVTADVVERPTFGTREVEPSADMAPTTEVAPVEVTSAEVATVETTGSTTDPTAVAGEVAATDSARHSQVGTYISEEHVLARFDESANDWFQVAADSPLLSGQKIIALPAYRPQLLLVPNIKVTLAGESHLELGRTEEATGPSLKLQAGRATIVPLGDANAVLTLNVGDRTGLVSFGDSDSVSAVELVNYLPPGSNPELAPAIPILQLFGVSGLVTWEEGGDKFEVNAGQVLVVGGDAAPQLFEAGELPAWITGKDLAEIDRLASSELRGGLELDRPLSLSLLERTEFRRVEVASLACRSLVSLNMFEPSIEALDGERLRSYWYAQFNALRDSMARDPEAAAKLQRSLEKLAGDDAGLMYELLCGFNPEQLAGGGAKELVDALENERVSVRVLAYENLRRITGKTQLFRPEKQPDSQKGTVSKWRQILAGGQIVYQDPPLALPKRRPAP